MKTCRDYLNFIIDENSRFEWLAYRGLCNWMSDEQYIRKKFRARLGYEMDLKNPKTFNEKLQWLKLHDRNPFYTTIVDKYEVKEFVSEKIGKQYVIPTLGVWDKFDDIDFKKLPDRFVLKCTHDSGGLYICKDKSTLDVDEARKKIERSLRKNYYYLNREWPYKNVKPRILAEEYMEDESGSNELTDYKYMSFNGEVLATFTCTERYTSTGLKVTFFDRNWNVMPFERHYHKSDKEIKKPQNHTEMVQLTEALSKDIPFVRVDFYEINGGIYFGEFTFYPGGGFEEFTPFEWDRTLGEWLQLP